MPDRTIGPGALLASAEALGIVRARTRGTLLPGLVSLWVPIDGPVAGIPDVAGNVGGDRSLAEVVGTLVGAASAEAANLERRVS